jgi:alkanesulfonate monooxygenase SsuD/methylene tetrahydromethanopterin reductase-like flavin-dependent oxidoreductase (luciferase family)
VQAGASEQGLNIAAANADVVYAAHQDIAAAKAYYADLKGRVASQGRSPDHLLIMPGVTPFVGRTRQEARDKFDLLNALVDPVLGLSYLYGQMGDLSGYPVDGTVPEPNNPELRSLAKNLLGIARRDNLTIRQLYTQVAAGFGLRVFVGTAADLVDEMEAWVSEGAADGFNICPPVLPLSLDDFNDMVMPELRRRRMFRSEYEGRTLRDNLGLPMPGNRYSLSEGA